MYWLFTKVRNTWMGHSFLLLKDSGGGGWFKRWGWGRGWVLFKPVECEVPSVFQCPVGKTTCIKTTHSWKYRSGKGWAGDVNMLLVIANTMGVGVVGEREFWEKNSRKHQSLAVSWRKRVQKKGSYNWLEELEEKESKETKQENNFNKERANSTK